MTSQVNVRVYRPRQQVLSKATHRKESRFAGVLSGVRTRVLAGLLAVSLVVGLAVTQCIHGLMTTMHAKAEQVRVENMAVADKNMRLLATRAQMTSRTQVAALAKTKLNLFEPDQRQVRRM